MTNKNLTIKVVQKRHIIFVFYISFILLSLSGCSLVSLLSHNSSSIKGYTFNNCSNSDINKAIKCLMLNNPQYKPDTVLYKYSLMHFGFDNSTEEGRTWNADSVNFHFYIQTNQNKLFFWLTGGRGETSYDEWNQKYITQSITLRYYTIINLKEKGIWQKYVKNVKDRENYDNWIKHPENYPEPPNIEMDSIFLTPRKSIDDRDYGIFKFKLKSKDKNIKLFEAEILPKIRYYLEHPEECK